MENCEKDGLISSKQIEDNDTTKENNRKSRKEESDLSNKNLSEEKVELLRETSSLLCRSLENFDENAEKINNITFESQNLSKSSGYISQMKDDNDTEICKRSKGNDFAKNIQPIFISDRCLPCDDSSCSDTSPIQPNVYLQQQQHINNRILFRTRSIPNSTDKVLIQPCIMRYETSQSSDSIICRICHSFGDEKLIAPCGCSGSSRYVHATCLVTWFKKSVKHQCELCKSDVKIRKTTHRIRLWRKPEDRPVPLIWFSVFFIGLFLNIVSIYVNASEYCKSTACLIFYVVNGFGIILDAAFLWFWFLKCRHYWKKWCALNQDWFIDDRTSDEDVCVQYVQGCPV